MKNLFKTWMIFIICFFFVFKAQAEMPKLSTIINNQAEAVYYDVAIKNYRKKYSNLVSLTIGEVIDFNLTPENINLEKYKEDSVFFSHVLENKSNTTININISFSALIDSQFDLINRTYAIDENNNGIIDSDDTLLLLDTPNSIAFEIGESKKLLLTGTVPSVSDTNAISKIKITAAVPLQKTIEAMDTITIKEEPELEISGYVNPTISSQGGFASFYFDLKNDSDSNVLPKDVFIDSSNMNFVIVESKLPTNTIFENNNIGSEDYFAYHIVGMPEYSYTTTIPSDKKSIDKIAFLYNDFIVGRNEIGSYTVRINDNASDFVKTGFSTIYSKDITTTEKKETDELIVSIPKHEVSFDNYYEDFKGVTKIIRIEDNLNIRADAAICNQDSSVREEYTLNLTTDLSKDLDTTYTIKETEINSGIFEIENIPTRSVNDYSVEHNNKFLELSQKDTINVELICNSTQLSMDVLVDPLGIVFDSETNLPIENIKVTLMGVDSLGNEYTPVVYNLEGNEISNEQLTDKNGQYWFPQVEKGDYKIKISNNDNYLFPSSKTPLELSSNRYIDASGSFGGSFEVKEVIENNGVILLDIPLDPVVNNNILIQKTADKDIVEIGEIVEYTITVKNLSSDLVTDLNLVDTLPLGVDIMNSSTHGYKKENNVITFSIKEIEADSEVEVIYKSLIKMNAINGTGVNTAFAYNNKYKSNTAKHKLEIQQETAFENPLILGKIFKDCNNNKVKDEAEIGIPGVKVYLNNGYYSITDKNGNYKFYNLKAKTYGLRIDKTTLPKPYSFQVINNRNAKDPYSAFVDLKYGELHRRDFRDIDCSHDSILNIENRNKNLSELNSEIEKAANKELDFNDSSKENLEDEIDAGIINELPVNITKIYNDDITIVKPLVVPVIKRENLELAEDINFDTDSSFVKEKYNNPIKEIVENLKEDKDLTIVLVGHTDNRASKEYNKKLSERRASAVSQKLLDAGVELHRITTLGEGEEISKGDNATKEGQAKNRRVEIFYHKDKKDDKIIPVVIPIKESLIGVPLMSPVITPEQTIIQEKPEKPKNDLVQEPINVLTTINLENYAKEINYNKSLGFVDLKDGDVVSKNQISVRIKGRSAGMVQLMVNNEIVPESKIGQTLNFKQHDLKIMEYIAVKLKTGDNILKVRIVDPFGNERGSKEIKVTAAGQLKQIVLELPEGNKIPANNTKTYPIKVFTTDENNVELKNKYVVTLNTTIGQWDVKDINDKEDGIQAIIENGYKTFDFIPPSEAAKGEITATINDIEVKEEIFATTYLRDMFAIGIVEGAFNFKDDNLNDNIKTTGLEEEINSMELFDEANGRVSLFLKGRVKGDYLLTLAYDSDKTEDEKLYEDIEPEEFYPIYGDSSINGFEAQSTSKLFVKVAKNNSYIMYGDFNTRNKDNNANLSNYNRTLTGVEQEYQKEGLIINYYVAQETDSSRVKELEGMGTYGIYEFADSETVVENSEVVSIVVKDKNTGAILSTEEKVRFKDYEINGFYEGIIFREIIPTVDEDFNPVYVKIEYETESENEEYLVYGIKGTYSINKDLKVGLNYNKSNEANNDVEIKGATLAYTKDNLKTTVEIAESNINGEKGLASKINVKYSTKKANSEITIENTDDKFENEYSSAQSDSVKVNIKTNNKLSKTTSLKTDNYYTKDNEENKENKSVKVTVLKNVKDNLKLEGGLRNNNTTTETNTTNSTMLSSKVSWQPKKLKDLTTSFEYEQDIDVADINRVEANIEYKLNDRSNLYLKQERLSNMESEIETSETNTEKISTILGTKYGLNKSTEVYSEYRIDEAISETDAEVAVGVKNKFEINKEWKGNVSFEKVSQVEGEESDSMSVTTNFENTLSKDWKMTYKLQYSNNDSNDFYLGSIGYIRKLDENYSLLVKDTLAFDEEDSEWKNKFSSGLAYRDNNKNELNALFKYENEFEEIDGLYDMTNQLTVQFNKQFDHNMSLSGMYSLKYIDSEQENYNYVANWLSSKYSYDINNDYDVSLTGGYLFDNETSDNYMIGVEAGYLVKENMWLSLGYNFEGLSDNNYSNSTYYQQGAYLKFKLKLTEEDFRWLQ